LPDGKDHDIRDENKKVRNEIFSNFEFLQERFRAVDEAVSGFRRFLEGTIVEVNRNFDKVRSASAMVEKRLDQGDKRFRDLSCLSSRGRSCRFSTQD